jgi:hypothetical protein
MILVIDRVLSGLLILGAIGHTLGVLKYYKGQPHPLFWALCGTVLILMVAALNLLRSSRPADNNLAWVAAAASAAYMAISISFGFLVDNPFDARAMAFAAVSLGLSLIGIRQALVG